MVLNPKQYIQFCTAHALASLLALALSTLGTLICDRANLLLTV